MFEDVRKTLPLVSHFAGRRLDEMSMRPSRSTRCDPAATTRRRGSPTWTSTTPSARCASPLSPGSPARLFLEAKDKELALALRARLQRLDGRGVVRRQRRPAHPAVLVPLWDPALAAAEVRRNAARGGRAITFTELPANLGLPSIHDPSRHWDPLFAACDETGTVVCMHIGSGSRMRRRRAPTRPPGVRTALDVAQRATCRMADWLLSGALVRFPHLKIAFSESQIGWMPFLLERLDQRVHEARRVGRASTRVITDLPISYVPGRVYGCFFDDMVGVDDARTRSASSQLVFETDYPHQDTTWPDTPEARRGDRGAGRRPTSSRCSCAATRSRMLDLDPGDLRPEHCALRGSRP